MAKVFDIILNSQLDLEIKNGDFVVEESDAQHIELLLRASKGQFRQFPEVGVGLRKYLNAPYGPSQASALAREITIQTELDGYRLTEIDTRDITSIKLDAERL